MRLAIANIPTNPNCTMMKKIILIFAAPLMMGVSQASIVITPTNVTASTNWPDVSREPGNTIDGVGMNFDGFVTAANLHTYTYDNDTNSFWHANEAPAGVWIEFDLGSVLGQNLETMVVWNLQPSDGFPGEVTRGFEQFDIVLLDGSMSPIATFNDVTLAGPPVAQDFSTGEIVDFADTAGVRYVRLELDSNFDGSNFAGLSEVRFTAADPVPEPSSIGLLGLGGLVLILRRKK